MCLARPCLPGCAVRCGAGGFPLAAGLAAAQGAGGVGGSAGAGQSGVLAGDRLAFCRACGREMTPAWFLVR